MKCGTRNWGACTWTEKFGAWTYRVPVKLAWKPAEVRTGARVYCVTAKSPRSLQLQHTQFTASPSPAPAHTIHYKSLSISGTEIILTPSAAIKDYACPQSGTVVVVVVVVVVLLFVCCRRCSFVVTVVILLLLLSCCCCCRVVVVVVLLLLLYQRNFGIRNESMKGFNLQTWMRPTGTFTSRVELYFNKACLLTIWKQNLAFRPHVSSSKLILLLWNLLFATQIKFVEQI